MLADPFERDEIERLVPGERSADRAAGLLPVEVGERSAVRRLRGEPFDALVMKQTALDLVGSRLGDDVDDAAGRVAELGARAGRDHLELLDRLERDVDRRALAADLLAEESVRVVAAIEADVVEHAALSGEGDLVAVGPLHDADSRRERQEILELATQDRRGFNRRLVERAC